MTTLPPIRKLRETLSKSGIVLELSQTLELLKEGVASLRSQQELLKRRGIGMPPGVLETLTMVSTRLRTLRDQVERERMELEQLRALAQVSTLVNSSLDLDTVLNTLMDSVIKLTGAERGYILLNDPNTQEIAFRVSRSVEILPGANEDISTTVVKQVIASGEAVLTDNAVDDPRMRSNKSVMSFGMRSILCVPIKRKNEIEGAIYLSNILMTGVFEDFEVKVLMLFADQAAIAIDNAQAFGKVKQELQQLRIEIDMGRTNKQVGEITETQYFQEIAHRAADLRKRKSGEDSGA
ncbi:MAG: GAF domain-containing protein [Chloroflexi bacterium]|nr:GAF domain-containing protein [Chloroflexota bacterium]